VARAAAAAEGVDLEEVEELSAEEAAALDPVQAVMQASARAAAQAVVVVSMCMASAELAVPDYQREVEEDLGSAEPSIF
jgi:hypothetical protein